MATAGAVASTFRGPHIAFLPGCVTCPLAGVGTRAADASNRLVVDDPATRVTIDGSTITLADDRACSPKTPIADFVWLATGPAPFTIHLEVFKSGHTWSIDLHTHEPASLVDRHTARYEPFTIVAIDGDRREVLVDLATLARAVAHVPLARRLSSKLMTTRDHVRSAAIDRGGGIDRDAGVLFDRSIGIGALGRGSFLVRVRLAQITERHASTASGGASTASGGAQASIQSHASVPTLASMLSSGEWELSVEALTERYLPEIVARDLRLYGLANVPLLAELAAGRLRKGQTLAFRTTDEVRLDDRIAPLPGARDLARTYIEFHMLGGIIAAALR
ncbi:MAG: hypothetical protein ACKV2T_24915 [Kofleriaceae bacterium]